MSKPNLFLLSTHGTWGSTDGSKLDEIIQLFENKAQKAINAYSGSSKTVYLGYDGDTIQEYCKSKLGKTMKDENGISQQDLKELKDYNSSIILLEDLVPPTLYLLVMINKFSRKDFEVILVQCQNNYISCFSIIADYLDTPAGKIWVKRLKLNSDEVKGILRLHTNVSNTFIDNKKDELLTCEGKEAKNFASGSTNLGDFHTGEDKGLVYGGITFDGEHLVGSTKCWQLYLDNNRDQFENVFYVPAWNNEFTNKKDPFADYDDNTLEGHREGDLRTATITTMIRYAILKGKFTYNRKKILVIENWTSVTGIIKKFGNRVGGGSRKRKNKTKRKKSKKKKQK